MRARGKEETYSSFISVKAHFFTVLFLLVLRWIQVGSGGGGWSQVESGGIRSLPVESGGVRCTQVVSGGLRWSQEDSDGFR